VAPARNTPATDNLYAAMTMDGTSSVHLIRIEAEEIAKSPIPIIIYVRKVSLNLIVKRFRRYNTDRNRCKLFGGAFIYNVQFILLNI